MKGIITTTIIFIFLFIGSSVLEAANVKTYTIQVPKHIVLTHHPDWATLDLDEKEFILTVHAPWKLREECFRNIVINMNKSECVNYGAFFKLVDRKDIESGKIKVDYVFFK